MNKKVINDIQLDTRPGDSKQYYLEGIGHGIFGIAILLNAARTPVVPFRMILSANSTLPFMASYQTYQQYRKALIEESLKPRKPFHLNGFNKANFNKNNEKGMAYTITKE